MTWQSNINIFKWLYVKHLKHFGIGLRNKVNIIIFLLFYLFLINFLNFIYVKLLFIIIHIYNVVYETLSLRTIF